METKLKIPRLGTRVRALFDVICLYPNGVVWRDAKVAYDSAGKALGYRSRQYSALEVSRQLKRFCTYTGERGHRIYKLKPEWAQVAVNDSAFQLSTTADLGKLRAIAENPSGQVFVTPVDPLPPQHIFPGDWVVLKDYPPPAMLSRGVTSQGPHKVKNVEYKHNDTWFVTLEGIQGGWFQDRFVKYELDPKIETQEDAELSTHGSLSVSKTTQTQNSETAQLKRVFREHLQKIHEMVSGVQYSEVGQVYSGCDDVKAHIVSIMDEMEGDA